MIELGVNIDHVTTLRQARGGKSPDIIAAAKICELAGAHQITVHLREDRRHIQDADVWKLKDTLMVRLNLEMAATPEIIGIAHQVKPDIVCIVPEKREEITTEGGLDVRTHQEYLMGVIEGMHERDIRVSLFIDPVPEQLHAAMEAGADAVELHTGAYANATEAGKEQELDRIWECVELADEIPLACHAGHGLTVRNLLPIASMEGIQEVNIGHDIVARALFIGLDAAVKEILAVLRDAELGLMP